MASPLNMPKRRNDHAHSVVRPILVSTPVFDYDEDHVAFCFVCSRVTDHWGEHDGLVAAGMVRYAANGNVYRTETYDADKAKKIVDAEVAYFLHDLNLTQQAEAEADEAVHVSEQDRIAAMFADLDLIQSAQPGETLMPLAVFLDRITPHTEKDSL